MKKKLVSISFQTVTYSSIFWCKNTTLTQFVNGFMKLSDETNSPYIHNHSKALAFNKFKPILYKHYSRFKKISRLGNHLNQSLVVLYDYTIAR